MFLPKGHVPLCLLDNETLVNIGEIGASRHILIMYFSTKKLDQKTLQDITNKDSSLKLKYKMCYFIKQPFFNFLGDCCHQQSGHLGPCVAPFRSSGQKD